MLKHAIAAVGALSALALATTSGATAGLPKGKLQHSVPSFVTPIDKGPTRPGQGFLRSMDAGATGHRAAVPTGSVRFLIDGSSANAAPQTNSRGMLVPAVKAIREAAPGRRLSPGIVLHRLAVPKRPAMHHGLVNRFSQGHRLRY
jgi:hypothetical protein